MAKVRLEESDLFMNKSPRMPILIAVETSDQVMEDASNIRSVRRGLKQLAENLTESLSLKSLADVCLISFGDRAHLTRKFGTLEEGSIPEPELIGGKAELKEALRFMIREYRLRLNDYETNHIKRYTPVFFLLCCDRSIEEESAEMSQLRHWSRTGTVTVLPVALGEETGNSLSALTLDGVVYQMNSLNYEKIFDTLGKSIEMMSRSSANAVESLKLKSIEWDQFKRK